MKQRRTLVNVQNRGGDVNMWIDLEHLEKVQAYDRGTQCPSPFCAGRLARMDPPNRADVKCTRCQQTYPWSGR